MNSQRIRLDSVDIGERLRSVDEDYARLIAESMAESGQITAIDVRRPASGQYRLIAGAHRVSAARMLGWTEIDAIVREVADLAAELLEIDENLIRRELSELDRAAFLSRRKAIHEAMHPETKRGKYERGEHKRQNVAFAFAKDAGEKLRLSHRTIERAIARFARIAPDVRQMIAGTWLADHATQLDALGRLDAETQRQVVRRLTAATPTERDVAGAVAALQGRRKPAPDPDADSLRRLSEAWRKATPKARAAHIADLISLGLVQRKAKP